MNSCNSLYHANWNTFVNHPTYKPRTANLHSILGYDSDGFEDPKILQLWATYMTAGKATVSSNGVSTSTPMTIKAAWFAATKDEYHANGVKYAITITSAIANDTACANDSLTTYSSPAGGDWGYDSAPAYIP